MTWQISRAILVLSLVLLTQPSISQADSTPIVLGQHLSIHSEILDEERGLSIWLPRTYSMNLEDFPVLYLLDGSTHFQITTAIVHFLSVNAMIPEMIVVAIDNTDRNRDLTPASQNQMEIQRLPTQGGADKFQAFIQQELMPWVEMNYQTHPYNILVGHSFGGLFAINTLFTNPTLFDAYIAISPSLQWSDQALAKQADAYFDTIEELPVTLYMSVGNEGNQLLGGVRKLAGVLDEKAPRDFQWDFKHMPMETHGSVPLRSIHDGLEFVFANWDLRNPMETYNQFGIDAINKFYAEGDRRYKVKRGIPMNTFASLFYNFVRNAQLDEAMSLVQSSLDTLNPPAQMLGYLADALKANDRKEEAINWYRAALARNPGNPSARAALAQWDVDYSDLIPNIVLGSDAKQGFVGQYEIQEAGVIRVVLENGVLLREYNGTRFELHPMNNNQFYIIESDLIYQFNLADDGEIKGVLIDQSGFPVYAQRFQ